MAGFLGVEKAKMLVPGNIDEDAEAVLEREVEEPVRRDVVNAEEVGAEGGDVAEVRIGLGGRSKEFAGGIGRERTVGDAFDVKFLGAKAKEFSVRPDASIGGTRGGGNFG